MENVGHFGEQRDEFENLRVPDGSRLIQVEKVLEFFLEIALKSCQLGLLIDFWFTLLASPGIFSTIRSLISPKEWALAVLHVFQLFDLHELLWNLVHPIKVHLLRDPFVALELELDIMQLIEGLKRELVVARVQLIHIRDQEVISFLELRDFLLRSGYSLLSGELSLFFSVSLGFLAFFLKLVDLNLKLAPFIRRGGQCVADMF